MDIMDIIARSLMIGKFDPTPVKEFLESLPPEDWGEFTQRQDQFDAHKATNTIAAIFPDRSNYPHLNMHQYKHTEKLMEWVKPIGDAFCEKYLDKPFVCTTAIFVKLAPNSNIANHSDSHPYFGVTHRIHWCIDGDYDNMHFMIAGQKVDMYEGDAIEINNRLPHSVAYTGEIPRINGIIDYMEVPPQKEKPKDDIPKVL
tara:strand:- start:12462 stop:13061 length:600 start_codon:yes stop_codon:yes gene_type:complete